MVDQSHEVVDRVVDQNVVQQDVVDQHVLYLDEVDQNVVDQDYYLFVLDFF